MFRAITCLTILLLSLPHFADAKAQDKLSYAKATSPLFYRLQTEAAFSPKRTQRYDASLIFKIKPGSDDQLEIYDQRILRSSRNLGYRSNESFFPLERNFYLGGSSVPTIIDDQGKLKELRGPVWMMGLPVDLSRVAFPPIEDSDSWILEEPISLVRSSNGTLQLASVAPQIKTRSRGYRNPDDQAESVVSIARTTYEVIKRDDKTVTIKETLELDGTKFSPQVSLSGTGTIVFSIERSSVDSIKREYTVKCEEPNRRIIVPMKFSLTRFTEEDMQAYEEEQRLRAERTAKIKAEQEAMKQQVPDLADREAVLAALNDAPKELFDALIGKLESEKQSDDPELGMACYEQLFKRTRPPYHTKSVVVRLAPDLEKTTDLADKYASTYSSFNIGLTGDPIEADTKLIKEQIVCYRDSGSSFHAGHFYGAVEDVLVIRTRATTPKLLAIKREKCRLPVKDFIDPAVVHAK